VVAPDLIDRHYERQRRELIDVLRAHGIDDMDVLAAVDRVPRHRFVPEAVRHRAYQDSPLPIGFGQTTSQPSLQAIYLQVLRIGRGDKVLEIGTGTGYQTALLAQLADRVYSVERVRELSLEARRTLDELRLSNVALLVGDGTIGWSRYAPYDAILVAAGAPAVPATLREQLADGGRMLVPVGDRAEQRLVQVRRRGEVFEEEDITRCSFVPLIGREGWRNDV
jgi:protein-L-isoaspartate(D-aspartate) O-methyltransferase